MSHDPSPLDTPSPDPAADDDRRAETRSLTRRYLVIHGLRWLPVGLLVPIMVLLFTSRGLSLTEFGLVTAIMTGTAFALELPTGGLADALGRKRVLLFAAAFLLLAKVGFLAISLSSGRPAGWLVLVASLSMGIYRALESGPLDAWYVDALHAIDADADVTAGLGRAGGVTGVAIAIGSVAAGGLLAWDPIPGLDPMALVVGVATALAIAQTVAIATLMSEVRAPLGWPVLADSVRDVPRVIRSSLGLVRASRILALLLVVEATASIGMVAFEVLFPVRLETLTGSTQAAAAMMGPVSAAGWAAAGAGAALVARASRRLGPYRTSMALRVVQAATIMAMALAMGPVGVIVGFVAAYLVHGAFNPVHMALVHDQVGSDRRATVLSLNSMVASAAYTASAVAVGAVADTWSVPVAMTACAAVCLVAVPPLMRARRLAAHQAPPPSGPATDDDRVGLTTA